jgi:hypothetical protein
VKRGFLLVNLSFVLFVLPVTAQIKLGIKGGISTYDLGLNDVLSITNNSDEFELGISDAKYGYHIGVVVQVRLGGFVLQPEAVFNSNSVDFRFEDITNPMPGRVFTEKYQNLDIPLMLGLKAGPIRIITGPVGHYFLKSTSDLLDYESYSQHFRDLTYGWQVGIGLDFFNLMLDVRYEGNFSKFGEHIYFFGNRYTFSNSPSRLLGSLAITIG